MTKHFESPLDELWVSIDLETTGLSFDKDEIIEIGAVKFKRDKIIDTFHTFVNPYRQLDDFIKNYTGITQEDVDHAGPFSDVIPRLASFIASAPIVGHNIAFDHGFLSSKGLDLSNERCDTWDMAFVFVPGGKEYGLSKIASELGIEHPRPHRALDDAIVTQKLFVKLADIANDINVVTLNEMERLASSSSWVLSYFLRSLIKTKLHSKSISSRQKVDSLLTGESFFNVEILKKRLSKFNSLNPRKLVKKIDKCQVSSIFHNKEMLGSALQHYEKRSEQIAMARSVTDAVNEGHRLVVEAGTGVGKSLAYMMPAVMYAMLNNKRVVVSTNTINLQEQLLIKDVPALVKVLSHIDSVEIDDFRFTQLKGRSNYLCLRRWSQMRASENISIDESRLLSKLLVWLGSTITGDRGELNLGRRVQRGNWDQISAQGETNCFGIDGICFLRSARERAAGSHLVIVNHALLMSDLMAGGTLIPDYDVLIVDEAQHLEDVATRHLGFDLSQRSIEEYFQSIAGDRGLLGTIVYAFNRSSVAETRKVTVREIVDRISVLLPLLRENLSGTFGLLYNFMEVGVVRTSVMPQELRITSAVRKQPEWSDLEIQYDNFGVLLAQLKNELTNMSVALEGLDDSDIVDCVGITLELGVMIQRDSVLCEELVEFFSKPKPGSVYWVSNSPKSGDVGLHSVPLDVGQELDDLLFSQKESVVLTSATLSTNGNFDHIIERTGFKSTDELLLGSPFDYPNAALLCVPNNMPEPGSQDYQLSINQAIVSSAIAAQGRTMVLFTSHSALQSAAAAIRGTLRTHEIDLLAQGVDGQPYQLVSKFLQNPRSVLLGTSSFWEGVDLAGDVLKVLLVARLPFSVPTEPVFEARSESYEDSFNEYALPQAILRFRQGFGRLIRTSTDKGVVVILDKRIISKRYGEKFLQSLPPVRLKLCELQSLSQEIDDWIGVRVDDNSSNKAV